MVSRGISALDAAVRLLRASDRTAAALRARLEAKGFPAVDVEAALKRARELGYLDEARCARSLVARWVERGASGALIESKLRAAGVVAAIARDALAELPTERELADRAVQRQRSRGVNSSARLARHLSSRGFSEEIVEDLVDVERT